MKYLVLFLVFTFYYAQAQDNFGKAQPLKIEFQELEKSDRKSEKTTTDTSNKTNNIANYTYLSGDSVAYFENFEDYSDSEIFPAWEPQENARLQFYEPEKQLFAEISSGLLKAKYLNAINFDFTLEFDFIPKLDTLASKEFSFSIALANFKESPNDFANKLDIQSGIEFSVDKSKNIALASNHDGDALFTKKANFQFEINKLYRIAIKYFKNKAWIYINGKSIIEVNKAKITSNELNNIAFWFNKGSKALISNVKLAKITDDYSEILKNNGKLLTYSLEYANDYSELKENSYGLINFLINYLKNDKKANIFVKLYVKDNLEMEPAPERANQLANMIKRELQVKFGEKSNLIDIKVAELQEDDNRFNYFYERRLQRFRLDIIRR